jgi:pyruvate/2-oxoglutarate dehydrogenase complex dihydrolipoamide acyltransferase (E2) component
VALKRYEAKADGLNLTFPNVRTGETVDIREWPYTTEDVDEQRFLANHPFVEEAAEQPVEATGPAERRAAELGVDLTGVEGTGTDGRITVGDVEKAAQSEAEEDE